MRLRGLGVGMFGVIVITSVVPAVDDDVGGHSAFLRNRTRIQPSTNLNGVLPAL